MFALVTGASSGIGKEYATALAAKYHHNLILVSNQKEQLEALATQLSAEYCIKAVPYYADLSRQEAAQEIYDWCKEQGLEVDVLINNAGMFFWQPLIDLPPQRVATMLNLHMFTLAMLCRLFGDDMCKRAQLKKGCKGYILNMASITAKMTFPGIQCYNSTKAFVYSFSKSLYYEMRPFGVTVTTLTPGAIDTPLYGLDDNVRRKLVKFGISLTPDKLAQIALKRLFDGKKTAMPGWINHIALPIIIHLPDWAIFFAMKRLPQYKSIPL